MFLPLSWHGQKCCDAASEEVIEANALDRLQPLKQEESFHPAGSPNDFRGGSVKTSSLGLAIRQLLCDAHDPARLLEPRSALVVQGVFFHLSFHERKNGLCGSPAAVGEIQNLFMILHA